MNSRRTTVRDVRRTNRSALLSRLFLDGPVSRLELSRLTGLSAGTVSNVTGELIDEGVVVEAGLVESDGGRPRVLLRVDPAYGYVIGVDVGPTRVRTELFDLSMRALATVDRPVGAGDPDPGTVAALVAAGVREAVAGADVAAERVLGVGIGVFGTVERGRLALVHAPTVGWDAVPLEALIRAGTDLPLFIDNGAKTLGQAEMWFGAGRGARHAVFALVGSGVGAAIVTDGTTYQGTSSSAGEWGHTAIVYGGRPCRCGGRGCLEAYVGAQSLLDRYGAELPGDEEARLAALIDAADRSAAADRLLDETAGYLGVGIANLVNLFNPERIVLGGWAGLALGTRLLPRIREVAAAQALAHPFSEAAIELSRLGPDAVAMGAATLPIAELVARGGSRPPVQASSR
ncbi:ROK family transcriptional regulator [Planosporangium thailandense]|uniref:ROK family transcriptional regulator n=1 Tax=Planosporangium thailandense TaxID=765197 RepID=A0ABX0Y3N3_9ACTN|nr:ROK family transcriptional regulator [Planosporangium thailandense]NJC72996.1 ROK family transcriptional regulator [Planosporangium thailandense]